MRGSLLLTSWSVFCLVACSTQDTTTVATGGRVSPTYTGPSEKSYCSTTHTFGAAPTVTITGTAQYKRRDVSVAGLGSAASASTHAIRAAEVRVTDASGAEVQCAETDSVTGAFSFALPQGAVTYTVSVNSRSYNSFLRASVLNRPEQNVFYSLSTTVDASTNVAIGTMTAGVTGEILGAAFNILDQLFEANLFLRTQTGTGGSLCSTSFPGCTDVTMAAPVPKVSAYWEKGYNPNAYFGSSSGLSFYLPDYSRMFILGGINGDTDTSDTDHFDNSVIIHEYGHFLEDSMFESDSPGGSHDGNKVIDPRLAWSEGWGNFFQAAVLNDPHYYDSVGNADGSTYLAFNVDIENSALSTNGKDIPQSQGEGNFREFAVSRMLYDAVDAGAEVINPGTAADNVSGKFPEIWAALTKTTRGFRDSTFAFRNVGHLHLAQTWLQNNAGASDWTNIRNGNRHDGDTSEYAQLVSNGACGGFSYVIDPQAGDTSTLLSGSHMFLNNDFYHLKITSAGSYTLQLNYRDADGAGTKADLDLYLLNESARFASTADQVGKSINDRADTDPTHSETESITVTLSAGNYLINVNAYTGGGLTAAGNTEYELKLTPSGGAVQNLCPANIVQ